MLTGGVWSQFSHGAVDPSLVASAKLLVLGAKSANTKSKYQSYWKKFLRWASDKDVQQVSPADPSTVGLFLAETVLKSKSLSTFYAHVYAVRWAHEIRGLPDPTCQPFPKSVIEGAKRQNLGVPSQVKTFTSSMVKLICDQFGKLVISMKYGGDLKMDQPG